MKNIFLQARLALAGYDFFSAKHLCPPEIASNRFNSALKEARTFYHEQKSTGVAPELIHEEWLQNIKSLETYFANQMSADFISNEVVNGTMVFTDRHAFKVELKNTTEAYGKKTVSEVVSKNLNAAFLPGKCRRSTLINSVHHLHHLMRFEQCTGRRIADFENVIEFGGGYGNMARIVENLGACRTYSIVDLLLFSCIQYVFLNSVAGNGQAEFDVGNAKSDAKFFLHPLFRADSETMLRGELFLSTWALSESTRSAYEWVTACNWFGATSLLLAYNERWQPWHENELEESLKNTGWRVAREAIPFLPGSFYLFATR